MTRLKIYSLVTVLFLILNNGVSFAQNAEIYPQIQNRLDQLVIQDENLKKIPVGIIIKDLVNKKDIYYHDANHLFVPASNIKIYTSLLALEKLGSNFRFETTITTDGRVIQADNVRTVNGNVYINFTGDPVFTHEHLRQLFQVLIQNNIRKISGNIIINRFGSDNIMYGPGWMWDDFNDCYSAPLDVVTIDENCLRVSVLADSDSNFIVTTPNSVSFDNAQIKVSENTESGLNMSYDLSYNNQVKISGEIQKNLPARTEKSILNPETYVSNILRSIIQDSFIFTGRIITDSVAYDKHTMLARNYSQPLEVLLKRFNKESHNLIGEMLLKAVARKETGLGSTAEGSKIMRKYLEEKFKTDRFRIVDGSGLSRYNLVSPELTLTLLENIYNSSYRNIIFAAFPSGGEEGTLINRLKNLNEFNVIAKSGSMSGVNCLSGYLINGRNIIAFSIMINNTVLEGKILRDYQDKVLEIVAESIKNNNIKL